MRTLHAAAVAVVVAAAAPAAQQPPPAAPAQTPPAAPAQTSPANPAAPAQAARTFTAPVGLLINTVRPDRVADFEKVMAYVRAALEKSTDPTIRAQAAGWRIFKAAEPGPNGAVLYMFTLDPTVAGAEYALGPILADAYPDPTQLQEIWKLYTGSVTTGGTLLNLTPLAAVAPAPLIDTPATPSPDAAPPAPPLPDADPVRR
jgi:hypothetical protein